MKHHFSAGIKVEKHLRDIRPSLVVELGAGDGGNTKNLLRLGKEIGYHTVSISDGKNPLPGRKGYTYIRGVSYLCIGDVAGVIDACVLDTDHNYWTLMQELEALSKKMVSGGLVFIHDTEVYGRKGGYAEIYGSGDHYPKGDMEPTIDMGLMDAIEHSTGDWALMDKTVYSCGAALLRRL